MRKSEKLIYTNQRGESITFSPTSVYHINTPAGLSDVKNTLYTVNALGQDGDTYLGNRIECRDITITGSIATRDKTEAQTMRRQLNHVLNPHQTATLTYVDGDFRRVIDCHVNCAPAYSRTAIFQDFTIMLVCHNPFWRETSETKTAIAAWIGGMEFVSPEGLEIPDDGTWEIGYREPSRIVNVYNRGDVSGGIRIEFLATGTVQNPLLRNVNTGEFVQVNYTLTAGDVLTISTRYGEKAVTLTHNRENSNAFRYLDPDSSYMQLEVGDNLFYYDAEDNADSLEVSIYHNNQYLGV